MLDTVKEKIKANAQNKVYDKENKETIVKFRDTVIEDIHSTLADAQAVKQAAEKLMENGGTHTSKFVHDKLADELEYITSCINSLEQMDKKSPKKFRLMDIYKAYKRLQKTNRSLRNIKEYIHRLKEDNLMFIINENSQHD